MKLFTILKRLSLFIITCVFIPFIPNINPIVKSKYYVIPVCGISTYIILLNFPIIVENVHSKPLYYNDLENNLAIDLYTKQKFQIIFISIIRVTLSLLVIGILYYYYDRFNETNLSAVELFGILGGIYSLIFKIENVIGKSVLFLLNYFKSFSIYNSSISN